MKRFYLLIFPLFSFLPTHGQTPSTERLAFYNVENLFDTENDSLTNDDEFTPEGNRRWTNYKYQRKLHHTAKAILCIGEWKNTAIVGLAEVENRKVLEDLVQTSELKKLDYQIIHYPSSDRRGIDVAMLYQKSRFTPIFHQNIKVSFKADPYYRTRDMLYCKGLLLGDTLHWFMCHWPSRYGGQKQSEPKRIAAAQTLKMVIDSITGEVPNANVVIGGDFNDQWDSKSLLLHLKACKSNVTNCTLVNLMATAPVTIGSHKYQGSWAFLDQIIVSKSLLNPLNSINVTQAKAQVTTTPSLLEEDLKYPGKKPFRTFVGFRYNDGFSDHLPVYIDLTKATN
jgi:predicted extracellular nuclease